MVEIEVTEGVIRGLKQEFNKLVEEERQAHEKANELSRKRGVSEHILEQALEELMYAVDKNPKYRCPKCGGRVRSCEVWSDPESKFKKRFKAICTGCSGASTELLRTSRVEALLDWFDKCNEEEDENE